MRTSFVRLVVGLVVLGLSFGSIVPLQTLAINNTMVLEVSSEWRTTDNTIVTSVLSFDVDNDGTMEIVTGGVAYFVPSALAGGELKIWRRDQCCLTLLDTEVWFYPGPPQGGTQVHSVYVSDIDGDMSNEIITAGYTTINGVVYGELKAFTFSNDQLSAKGNPARWKPVGENAAIFNSVAASDINGDNSIEIVTAGYILSGRSWKAHLGVWHWSSQSSTFVLDANVMWQNANKDTKADSVAIADVNSDTTMDIVTAGYTGSLSHSYKEGEMHIYAYVFNPLFQIYELFLQTSITWRGADNMDTTATDVHIYDLDSDSDLDIVTSGTQHNGQQQEADVTVFDWEPTLQKKAEKHWYSVGYTRTLDVSALNIDDDADVEIVTVGSAAISTARAQIGVFYWSGGSVIYEDTKYDWYTDSHTRALAVDLANVDLDGQVEIITAGDHMTPSQTREPQLRIWNWDAPLSDTWTNKNPTIKPSARDEAEMAYHEAEKVSVLFGGLGTGGNPHLSDTWTYDSSTNTWTNKNPSAPPSARQEFAMVYDCVNEEILLFGGWNGNYLDDTWTYDLTTNTWTQMNPLPKPSARAAYMVSDCKNEVAVLFGGIGLSGPLSDTWVYDFNSGEWTNKNPTNPPGVRDDHKMAFDSCHGVTVLFGGLGGPLYSDTWTYDYPTNTWTNKNPSNPPLARYEHNMVFDSANGVVILFGGDADTMYGDFRSDTWVYDLDTNSWTEMNPTSNPSGRRKHAMTFDTANGVAVLFGGHIGGAPPHSQETWTYDYA